MSEDLRQLLSNFGEIDDALAQWPCLQRMLRAAGPTSFNETCIPGPPRCGIDLMARARVIRREVLNRTHAVCHLTWDQTATYPSLPTTGASGDDGNGQSGGSSGSVGSSISSAGGTRESESRQGMSTRSSRGRTSREGARSRLTYLKQLRDEGLLSERVWSERTAKVIDEALL